MRRRVAEILIFVFIKTQMKRSKGLLVYSLTVGNVYIHTGLHIKFSGGRTGPVEEIAVCTKRILQY